MMSHDIGEIATKDDLLGHLVSLRAAAVYDIFAQTCLHEFIKRWATGHADPETLTTLLPEGTITLRQFMNSLAAMGPRAQVETKRNANRFLTRNLLREGFRITQSYCEANGHIEKMKSKPWYQFARIVVNGLSHDFRIRFSRYDRSQLPVSYRGNAIDASMDGKTLRLKLGDLVALFDDIAQFVRNDLP